MVDWSGPTLPAGHTSSPGTRWHPVHGPLSRLRKSARPFRGSPVTAVGSATHRNASGADARLIEARSRERDLDGTLVPAARGVEKLDLELARVGRSECEREERVLGHVLGRVEGRHRLAEVGYDHLVDVVVVLLDDLALRVALDPLHRMDHERAHLDDVAGLDARRNAEPDLPDV